MSLVPSFKNASTRALAHPLPAGMRDVLPIEAQTYSRLSGAIMSVFASNGYQRVEVPAFEYSDVLEQGLGVLDPQDAVRFVEPETGEVVALRPDMTLQVARLVATRLAEAPPPVRLCYQGSVLRRRHERSRKHRQFYQAGIELVGEPGPKGDLEVLRVAMAATKAAGVDEFVLDLAHARIASSLLELAPVEQRGDLVEAIGLKDQAALCRLGESAGIRGRALQALIDLPSLHGGEEVFVRARPILQETPAGEALDQLERVCRLAFEHELAPRIVVDLGEVWNFAYYTGIMFQLLAEGPGEPLGAGGRYDGLLERFGIGREAAGFGLDLGHIAWARRASGQAEPVPIRFLIVPCGSTRNDVAESLRAEGYCAVDYDGGDPLGYTRSWCYSHIVWCGAADLKVERVPQTGEPSHVGTYADIRDLVARVRQRVDSL